MWSAARRFAPTREYPLRASTSWAVTLSWSATSLDTSFDNILYFELTTEFLNVDGLLFVGESGVASQHAQIIYSGLTTVMISSLTPSEKKSCFGSPERLSKGRTASAGPLDWV